MPDTTATPHLRAPREGERLATLNLQVGGTGEAAPDELRLFAAGKVDTTRGTFFFTRDSASMVIADARRWGNEHSADYEHAALHGGPAPAAAWYELDVRDTPDGPELWAASIKWTKRARQMIEAKEYRYISPAFFTDSDGQITGYINFALTNIPATRQMDALIAASLAGDAPTPGTSPRSAGVHPKEDAMKQIMQALGLNPDAHEDAALQEVQALRRDQQVMQALRGLVPDDADVVATVTAWRDGSARAEELAQALTARDQADATARVDTLLRQGQADRKLTPASAQALRTALADKDGQVDPAKVEAYLAAAPRIAGLAATPAKQPAGGADSGPTSATPTGDGKTGWEALSNVERANLRLQDADEFYRLLAEHRAARGSN